MLIAFVVFVPQAMIIQQIQSECEAQLSVIADKMDDNNRAMECGAQGSGVPQPPKLIYEHHAQLQNLFPIYEPEVIDYLSQHGHMPDPEAENLGSQGQSRSQSVRRSQFSQLDTNNDGVVDREEWDRGLVGGGNIPKQNVTWDEAPNREEDPEEEHRPGEARMSLTDRVQQQVRAALAKKGPSPSTSYPNTGRSTSPSGFSTETGTTTGRSLSGNSVVGSAYGAQEDASDRVPRPTPVKCTKDTVTLVWDGHGSPVRNKAEQPPNYGIEFVEVQDGDMVGQILAKPNNMGRVTTVSGLTPESAYWFRIRLGPNDSRGPGLVSAWSEVVQLGSRTFYLI